MQINKLEEKTRGDFEAMLKEIADHSAYLTETFKTGNEKQSKEFEYLELQSNILTEEHAKLHELSSGVMTRTAEVESNVGL